MPIYSYECRNSKCHRQGREFEVLKTVREYLVDKQMFCGQCRYKMARVIGRISVVTAATKWNAVCNVKRSKFFNENPLECPNG